MRKNNLSTWLGALLGTVLALLFSAYAHAQEFTEEFHHSYPLAANGSVDISNLNGTVRITGSDTNQVKVDAIKRADSKQKLDDAQIEVESSPNDFELRTRYHEHDSWFGEYHNPASVDYTISVPHNARLHAHVVNSRLEISGVSGEVRASTVNGQVTASGLMSSAEVTTVNSRAEATFDQLPASGHVKVSSVNGSAIVVIPANANAEVRAHSVNGSIHSDFNLQVEHPRYGPGSRVEGRLGSGGAEINLETVNGGIQIRQR
ncbi:MAG: DUF4097 family beta strand repeat protein [Acidobacteria bacterium]|nr:DUF4097 family beta strand repeat protein [Acidobacteriota bacterium]